MIGPYKVACVIPARLESSRFPKKVLQFLRGKPLLQWVWEAASDTKIFDSVSFAVDAKETEDLIASFYGTSFMTSRSHQTGTDRLIELMQTKAVKADIYVCWQCDEPFVKEAVIQDLLKTCETDGADVWTLKKRTHKKEEIESPHVPKVVCDANGFALYFSRSTIPFYRDPLSVSDKIYFKHIGIYAYTKEALLKISQSPPSYLDQGEMLEQLRFLYHGLKVKVSDTHHEVLGIDLPEHLAKAEHHLKTHFTA